MSNPIAGIGHNRPPRDPVGPTWLRKASARIARRGRAVDTCGHARAEEWVLTFERQTPPVVDGLTGWTGGEDTLATQVRLTFPSRAAALAYAERQGLDYNVEGQPRRKQNAPAPPATLRGTRHELPFGRGLAVQGRGSNASPRQPLFPDAPRSKAEIRPC